MSCLVLVGRPNVGKSTLFNRLVGKRQAIVYDTPGVTRDWQEGDGHLFDLSFQVIDTPGLAEDKQSSIAQAMEEQTKKAVERATLILFMVDGQTGLTPLDESLARWIRRYNKPILLLVNKCESKRIDPTEFYALNLGEPFSFSAAHGEGISLLYDQLSTLIEKDKEEDEKAADAIQLALIGRPNAGKSTLINAILKEPRVLTHHEAGTTRDAVYIHYTWEEHDFQLIDTAGMRRASRVDEDLEKESCHKTRQAIQYSPLVGLVVDATSPLDKQDLTLAHRVLDEGRILFIILNKMDLVVNPKKFIEQFEDELEHALPQVKGLRWIATSGLYGQGIEEIFKTALSLYDRWNQRFPTHALNTWLRKTVAAHEPPLVGRGRLKIRYITQFKSRPPTFMLCVNKEEIPANYLRYLENQLYEGFDLQGVPLRIKVKKTSGRIRAREE